MTLAPGGKDQYRCNVYSIGAGHGQRDAKHWQQRGQLADDRFAVWRGRAIGAEPRFDYYLLLLYPARMQQTDLFRHTNCSRRYDTPIAGASLPGRCLPG